MVTDRGEAYLKALGNPEGPHALASEWVGTSLAAWLGLPTFEFAIVPVDGVIEIPLGRGGHASPGPAFATRSEKGYPWSGGPKDLARVANLNAVAGLVVLDTWIRNRDRYCCGQGHVRCHPDNVFLSAHGAPAKKLVLKAVDHTHCFSGGGTLGPDLGRIDCIRDARVYGLFPAFRPHATYDAVVCWTEKLRTASEEDVQRIVDAIPREWEVDSATRQAMVRFVIERAGYVADTLPKALCSLLSRLWLP